MEKKLKHTHTQTERKWTTSSSCNSINIEQDWVTTKIKNSNNNGKKRRKIKENEKKKTTERWIQNIQYL